MKKNIFIKAVLLTVFASLSYAEDIENAAGSSINIDQIAQELETEESLESDEEVLIEEEVFDTESEDSVPESPLPVKNENYWRGKTAVAAENEFPKGIFAMAKGYFPGDTLTVFNSKTQETVNVLIIGSIDQDDLTGIKFSAEAARELKITEKTNANVVLDERINPPEVRESAAAKLVIFGDEADYSAFEQPVSISEDEEILTENRPENPDIIDEIAVELAETENTSKAEESEDVTPSEENENEEEPSPIEKPADDSYAAIVLDIPQSVEEQAEAEETAIENQEAAEEEGLLKPVVEESSAPDTETEASEEKTLPAVEPYPAPVFESKKPFEKKDCQAKASLPFNKLIANESMVRKGWYIQLAFLANEENLQKFADNYSNELKLFLIPHKNGYKIYAGVFSDQDKAGALDYVKSLGFKDAFARWLGR